eukprot:3919616-Rhodomonas_salina.2
MWSLVGGFSDAVRLRRWPGVEGSMPSLRSGALASASGCGLQWCMRGCSRVESVEAELASVEAELAS